MKIDVSFLEQTPYHYPVVINNIESLRLSGKIAIVTNPKVASLHLKKIEEILKGENYHVITIPEGEHYKNLKTVESILDQLFQLKFNRDSTLIAFGGGVVGDITGFCASIYQRGIDFIQIPTTLLAQVDASVGGKTGVNNSYGKNLIGTFHQPKSVYCQTDFLETLSDREFAAGVAEIIKMAVAFDKDFFEWLEKNSLKDKKNLSIAIEKSIRIKANVVSSDEKEQGVRSILNYGHTFGHVIEKETEYRKYLHGESVSIGINMANHLALELGTLTLVELERICELLQTYDLPLEYKIPDSQKFYEGFLLDKKTLNGDIFFVLPNSIGSYIKQSNIPKETIIKVLKKFT